MCNNCCSDLRLELLNCVKNSEEYGTNNLEALFIDLTGSIHAGRILCKLFHYWQSKELVYADRNDWYRMLRLTPAMLRGTTDQLRAVGVIVEHHLANNKRVNHYSLDVKRFWEALRGKFPALPEEMPYTCPVRELGNVGATKTALPITTKDSTLKNNTVVADSNPNPEGEDSAAKEAQAQLHEGLDYDPIIYKTFDAATAVRFVKQYGAADVMAACYQTAARGANNPGGYARSLLENGWIQRTLPRRNEPVTSREWETVSAAQQMLQTAPDDDCANRKFELSDDGDDADCKQSNLERLRQHQTEDVECDAKLAHRGPAWAINAWQMTANQLELQLGRDSFDTWLKDARLLAATEAECGTCSVRIEVRNVYARDMLQHRLYRSIRRVLSDVLNRSVEIVFEARPKPEQLPAPLAERIAGAGVS